MLRSIDKYEVFLASHPRFNEWVANIWLRDGNDLVVDLRFVDDPETFSSIASVSEDGVSQIYASIATFPRFLDILRNEKPLWVQLVAASGSLPPRILLRTGQEPIGEQEPRVGLTALRLSR